MAYLGQILLLSGCLALALFLGGAAVGGLIYGRLRVELTSPWIVRREQPLKFVAVVLFYLTASCVLCLVAFRVGSELLR